MKRFALFDLAVVAAFAAGLFAPALAYLAGMRPVEFEERPLAAAPEFALRRLMEKSFYAASGDFAFDLNPVRKPAAIATARLAFALFGDASTAQVVTGRKGWLFIRESIEQPCADPDALRARTANLARLQNVLEQSGRPAILAVAPDKAAVYPEMMTPAARAQAACAGFNRTALQAALEADNAAHLDLHSILAAQKREAPDLLFSPIDTHWSEFGSAAYARAVVEWLSPGLSPGGVEQTGVETKIPDEGRLSGLWFERQFPRVRFRRDGLQSRDCRAVSHAPPGPDYVHCTATSTGAPLSPKRVLFVHDSYAYTAWDQISQFYADTFYVHWQALTPERLSVLSRQADAVVFETASRAALARLEEHFGDSRLADAIERIPAGAEAEDIWPRQEEAGP